MAFHIYGDHSLSCSWNMFNICGHFIILYLFKIITSTVTVIPVVPVVPEERYVSFYIFISNSYFLFLETFLFLSH